MTRSAAAFVALASGSTLSWAASGSYQISTENDPRYAFGNETILGLGLTRSLYVNDAQLTTRSSLLTGITKAF